MNLLFALAGIGFVVWMMTECFNGCRTCPRVLRNRFAWARRRAKRLTPFQVTPPSVQ